MAKKRAPHAPPQLKKGFINKKYSAPGLSDEDVKDDLRKVTLYIRHDQVIAMEQIQLKERMRTGAKPHKSFLAQEAFDLLIRKYE